jgi:2-polyprenyl-6-methoxyphenol hydroxylase-like FAD-dependent oxidoreductase
LTRTIVIGGGVVGLCASILLAQDGHEVVVLERDPAPPPAPSEAWTSWPRQGVNQFRMLHLFLPRFNQIMKVEAPQVIDALIAAGGLRSNTLDGIPPEMGGGVGEGDEVFESVTARRPVAEAAIAGVAAATDGITIRRGEAVVGLLTSDSAGGVPHVIGVRTEAGEELHADLVVDAAGRRSALPRLLEAIGAPAPIEERDDSGFVYYGRHFRSDDGSIPPIFGPLLMPQDSLSILTLPADNGTWGVGLIAGGKDAPLRKLSDVETWERVLGAYPLAAHWMNGQPIDEGVAIMAKIEDRHRSFVVDGAPVATGVIPLADSWACTNPSVGRGISIGTMHSVALRDLLREQIADPTAFALAWHDATMATTEPWYRATLDFDRGRLAHIQASIDGVEFQPDPNYEMTCALQTAALKDPEVLRAFLKIVGVLELPEVALGSPELFEKVIALGGDWRNEGLPGPSRRELLELVGG